MEPDGPESAGLEVGPGGVAGRLRGALERGGRAGGVAGDMLDGRHRAGPEPVQRLRVGRRDRPPVRPRGGGGAVVVQEAIDHDLDQVAIGRPEHPEADEFVSQRRATRVVGPSGQHPAQVLGVDQPRLDGQGGEEQRALEAHGCGPGASEGGSVGPGAPVGRPGDGDSLPAAPGGFQLDRWAAGVASHGESVTARFLLMVWTNGGCSEWLSEPF